MRRWGLVAGRRKLCVSAAALAGEGDAAGRHEHTVGRHVPLDLEDAAELSDEPRVHLERGPDTRRSGKLARSESRHAQVPDSAGPVATRGRDGQTSRLCKQLHEDDGWHNRLTRKVPLKKEILRARHTPRGRVLAGGHSHDFLDQPHGRLMRQRVNPCSRSHAVATVYFLVAIRRPA